MVGEVTEITVSIVSGGRVKEQITRPLRSLDGGPAVTYKKVLRPVRDGFVYLDNVPLESDGVPADGSLCPAVVHPEDEITVSVVQNGRVKEQITRPLRSLDGAPAVTYKKILRPVREDCIYLDDVPLRNPEKRRDKPKPAGAGRTTAMPVPPQHTAPKIAPDQIEWDDSQKKVIDQPRNARVIVNAGPGTGKTAVACARVGNLIKYGVEPANIWLISFTRTAVQEIRGRIRSHVKDPGSAAAVSVSTIDSHAWALHSGFKDDAKLTGLYEDNIAKTIDRLKTGTQLGDYIRENLEHLIIDESQDVVGIRADFIEALIDKLSPSCGVTVFCDHAQSIYGWAEDKPVKTENSRPLIDRLVERSDFTVLSLEKVHRTDSEKLHRIFTDVRKLVLSASDDPAAKKQAVTDAIGKLAEKSGLKARELKIEELSDSALVLFRRRAEALLTSSYCGTVPHRLRMSGLPVVMHPWVGACFGDFADARITRNTFASLWKSRITWKTNGQSDADSAWAQLVEIAGTSKEVVDMKLLRRRLSRRQPPANMCAAEFGRHGPIIGTIHASKGREADAVFLMMPSGDDREDSDHEAETRVIFVGATRARSHLYIGTGFYPNSRNLPSGRVWSLNANDGDPSLMVEVGREGDIDAAGFAGRKFFATSNAVQKAQNRIQELIESPITGVIAWCVPNAEYAYSISDPKTNTLLGAFSERFNQDLWSLAPHAAGKRKWSRAKPPEKIPHLRLLGARTLVLAPDAPEASLLHEPWASTGFVLAPLAIGYTKVWFRRHGH